MSLTPLKPATPIDEGAPLEFVATAKELPPPGAEYLLTENRYFNCDPSEVGDGLVIAGIDGLEGDALGLRPFGDAACEFNLVYSTGTPDAETVLSAKPGGYLLGDGLRLGSGDLVICANNIHHSPAGARRRRIERVGLECALHSGGEWSDLLEVVASSEWAPWISDLRVSDGVLRLAYTRDFSFQFMNLSDNGRPSEDGIYEIVLTPLGGTLSASAPVKVADRTNPLSSMPDTEWVPSDDDRSSLGEVFDFDTKGPCQDGCSTPIPPVP